MIWIDSQQGIHCVCISYVGMIFRAILDELWKVIDYGTALLIS